MGVGLGWVCEWVGFGRMCLFVVVWVGWGFGLFVFCLGCLIGGFGFGFVVWFYLVCCVLL